MFDKKLLISLVPVLILTCFDLNRSYKKDSSIKSTTVSDEDSFQTNAEHIATVRLPKIKTQIIPTIKLLYCSALGYRSVLKQFSELIHKHYRNVAIVEEPYPPVRLKAFIARVLSALKITLIICLLFGQNPFQLFNITTPRLYFWALRNKLYVCLMIFFFSNSIESYLISTGAFEIYFNDVPLWSKLQTGRLPSADEFVQMLQTFINSSDNNTSKNI